MRCYINLIETGNTIYFSMLKHHYACSTEETLMKHFLQNYQTIWKKWLLVISHLFLFDKYIFSSMLNLAK